MSRGGVRTWKAMSCLVEEAAINRGMAGRDSPLEAKGLTVAGTPPCWHHGLAYPALGPTAPCVARVWGTIGDLGGRGGRAARIPFFF